MEKQKNDFNLSLERLFSSEPIDLLQQLFNLNLIIQKSNEDEIIAIWHTLNQAEYMIDHDNFYGKKQILELKNSVKSRMKAISQKEILDSAIERKNNYFKSITNSNN